MSIRVAMHRIQKAEMHEAESLAKFGSVSITDDEGCEVCLYFKGHGVAQAVADAINKAVGDDDA